MKIFTNCNRKKNWFPLINYRTCNHVDDKIKFWKYSQFVFSIPSTNISADYSFATSLAPSTSTDATNMKTFRNCDFYRLVREQPKITSILTSCWQRTSKLICWQIWSIFQTLRRSLFSFHMISDMAKRSRILYWFVVICWSC